VLTAASRLNDRDGRNQQPRQVDSEHASPIGEIARIDPAVVRFSAPSAERETKTQAGSIGATLLERAKELVDIPTRQTAALVLDLDEHSLGARANPERDGRPRPGELEGVLQEVSHDRGEDLPVSLDRHALFDRRDGQTDQYDDLFAIKSEVDCVRKRDMTARRVSPCTRGNASGLSAIRARSASRACAKSTPRRATRDSYQS
jgi:hypothetical protein